MATFYIYDEEGTYRGTTNNPDQAVRVGWVVSSNAPENLKVTRPRFNDKPRASLGADVFRPNFWSRPKVVNWVQSVLDGNDAVTHIDYMQLMLAHHSRDAAKFKTLALKYQLINPKTRSRSVIRFRLRKANAELLTTKVQHRARIRFRTRLTPTVIAAPTV